MRSALILARFHDAPSFKVISGPEVPRNEQVSRFKTLLLNPDHPYAEVELWESDEGVTRRKRFNPPQPQQPEPADLAAVLAELSDDDLRGMAARSAVDITGLTDRLEIIKTIVLAIRERHLQSEAARPESEEASTSDPGVFEGPSLAPLPAASV